MTMLSRLALPGLLLLSLCGSRPMHAAGQLVQETVTIDKQKLSEIATRMREYVDAGQSAGMVMIVAQQGRIASFDAVGYRDLEDKKPMQKDTLFQIMSLTKPITCAAIMVLVDEGKLSVIDPVEKFLPGYNGVRVSSCAGRIGYNCRHNAPSRSINIEDLMTHTSGLPPGAAQEGGEPPKTLADLAESGDKTNLLFEPGSAWSYSNLGYDILGRIVEIVSKQPFDKFLKEHIFDPLAMKDTTFAPSNEQRSRLATVYTLANDRLIRAHHQFSTDDARIPHPAGGLISSAEDIFRFNLMMRNKGMLDGRRVLSSSAVALMTTSHTGDLQAGWVPGVGHAYGYEVVRNAEGMFRYNSIGSYVKGGAYRTYEFVDPAKDLIGVFMMQLTNGGGDTADEINSFIEMSEAAAN